MQGSLFLEKWRHGQCREHLPGKRRLGKCRVEPFREREAWEIQGSNFQEKGSMVNGGEYLPVRGRQGQALCGTMMCNVFIFPPVCVCF